MNRIRVRVGSNVQEYHIPEQAGDLLEDVEEYLEGMLHKSHALHRFDLDYLGEFAWDISVDGRKIGHAKAWNVLRGRRESETSSFWPIVQLAFAVYAALC